MLAPPGYTLTRRLHSGAASEVYFALRDSDRREVVLKACEDPARARGEHAALAAVSAPGVRQAFALLEVGGKPVLELEPLQGVPLGEWVRAGLPSPSAFLDVAIQLANALAGVHAVRLIHRDITPNNVIVHPTTLAAHLIDFGLSQPLGSATPTSLDVGTDGYEGSLSFISPEQTGRMDRGVDSRSDLYSLGATFYFALTGSRPFESADALALIHGHLARTPPSPLERRPDLPATLSRIVMKLLQKEPEDRYQTAQALARDLSECREQFRRTGRIGDDFPLGTADAPFRPLFAKRLYGREREIGALRAALLRSTGGAQAVALLGGSPGMGKSALVHELRRTLAEIDGYLAAGKYDLYRRDVPYSGFIAAFASLAHQLLTESNERLARWREELLAGLGALAPVAVELVPDLGFVLGDLPRAPVLGSAETQARLGLTVQRLVSACATSSHPLVLFLDDLQWSDPGSRFLLEELLASRQARALLVIAAYRDNEIDASHPLRAVLARIADPAAAVTRIALAPLDLEASAQMLSDALGRPPKETRTLVECIARKTGSSPLLIQQFVLHLHGQGLIRFEHPHGWSWDDGAIAAADIPDDAVALMVAKLESLSERPLAVIQLASCAGDEFDVDLLAELTGEPQAEVSAPLFELSQEGLISPSRRGFRFVHDRVREAAQALLRTDERARLHQRAGLLLLERTPEAELAERAFEIADHLNHALDQLSPEQRGRALRINLQAGRNALRTGAAATAASYLSFARALLDPACWQTDAALAFEVFWRASEAAFQTGDFALASQLLELLHQQPLAPLQEAQVLAKQISIVTIQDERAALELVLAGLRKYGVRWPSQPSWLRTRLEIARIDFLLRGPLDERAFRGTPANNAAWIAPTLLTRAGGSALVSSSHRLICLSAAYALRMYRKLGPLTGPALALAGYTAFRIALRGDLRGAERYARAAQYWLARMPDPVLSVRARYTLEAYVNAWLETRRGTLQPLLDVVHAAREIGDVEYAFLAQHQHADYTALVGEPLERVLETYQRAAGRVRNRFDHIGLLISTYALLTGDEPPGEDALRSLAQRADSADTERGLSRYARVHAVLVLTMLGEYARASEVAEAPVTHSSIVGAPGAHLADLTMCRGLCAIVRSESGRERRRWRRIARRCGRTLAEWARHGPDFVHMAGLLAAEHARVGGAASRALRLYREAAQRALAQRHVHHAALIEERCAEFLRGQRRFTEAAATLRDAVAHYKEWGARANVARLRSLRADLI
jgi:hypothetical protein